jgi:uncharacterized protein
MRYSHLTREIVMDSDQFDALVSRLSTQVTRRRGLGVLGVIGATGAGLVAETAAKKKHKKKKKHKPTTTQAPTTHLPPTSTTSAPLPSNIVISQIYTRGGNPDALYTRDYIELFNRSSTAVNVGNWSVQVSGAAAADWTAVPLAGFTLQPGHYLLIAGASGGPTGESLPGFDIDSSVSVLSGGGRIAVVASTAPLTCGASASCVTAPGVVDFLGYGTNGAHSEGGVPAPAPSSAQALFRKSGGCVDTNNNGPDFTLADPFPRTSTFAQVCS